MLQSNFVIRISTSVVAIRFIMAFVAAIVAPLGNSARVVQNSKNRQLNRVDIVIKVRDAESRALKFDRWLNGLFKNTGFIHSDIRKNNYYWEAFKRS